MIWSCLAFSGMQIARSRSMDNGQWAISTEYLQRVFIFDSFTEETTWKRLKTVFDDNKFAIGNHTHAESHSRLQSWWKKMKKKKFKRENKISVNINLITFVKSAQCAHAHSAHSARSPRIAHFDCHKTQEKSTHKSSQDSR